MATKKKTKKKSTTSKKAVGGKAKPTKKQTKSAPKKSVKKASSPGKAAARKKNVKNTKKRRTASASSQQTPSRGRSPRGPAFSRETPDPDSAGQSGDLQGLSDVESADSESVDELIEEGNAFEAGVVEGVEEADDDGPREVHTHEVPEDDVPEEYLDED
jgi:hypothetical protein